MASVGIAALYDVHGNLPALEAVLAEIAANPVDRIVVGGDVVAGPMPREVLSLLRDLGDDAVWVRGNGDREPGPWVASHLGASEHRFLSELPTSVTLDIDGLGPTLFCHGSPRSDEEILTLVSPEQRVASALTGVRERIVVCGHTHTQFDRRVAGVRLVNAGSVGMPYESQGGAYWALLTPDVDLRRTDYDVEAAVQQMREAGYPDGNHLENLVNVPSGEEAAAFFESQAQDANFENDW
ncbi:MAG TPA: metallophosphoesterase family protein [Gaiellaceae bacterium]|nr:metallophosphoesterase family protein [Gaiellaceae bacterium]